ncbi:MAG: hypothetical protein HRT35_34970, partial [Algicola sp.]|nr:hypothetical protein [Algicola sp.]
VDGATVTDEVISISGTIVTELSKEQLGVTLPGGLFQDLRLIGDRTWQFTFDQYQLQRGDNDIKVQVGYPGGVENLQMNVIYDDGYQPGAPVITIDSPTPEGSVSGADFTIEGSVSADSPMESLTLNAESVYLMSGNRFNYPVSFAANTDVITLVMVATDAEQRITTETYVYYRDAQGPQITLHNNLAPLPAINSVIENPYVVSGTIVDPALSSVLVNGQSITVSPGNSENSYDFTVRLPLDKQQTYQFDIKAYDQAGNFTALVYQLLSEQIATIDIIAPSGNTDFTTTSSSIDLQILARVNGLSDGDSVMGRVNNQSAEPLAVTDTMVNTTLFANINSGENSLVLEVLDNSGQVLASASKLFTVVNPDDIALTLRTEPFNGQTGAEPHGFIGFYFNKAIDISQLTVEVRETLHGLTYIDQDEPGVDITQVKGPALQQTDRDHQLVNGKLSIIPGNNIVAFYPDNNIGYGASVVVQVKYNGEELQRFGYKVRELPTFVDGTVMDQLNQAVTGIEVSLPELGLTTVTDSDGTFGFGYGTTVQSALPGGVYKLVINPGLKNPLFGSDYRYINIQQGKRTNLRLSRLMLLNVETPFQPVTSGKANVSLANGELNLDLSAAQLSFANGFGTNTSNSGNVHVSFLTPQNTNLTFLQGIAPVWLYGLQPAGITVSGQVGIQMKMPKLFGSLDYVPDSGSYVVLLGRDDTTDVMVPIGVGQIDGYTVKSKGPVNLQRLDFLAYAMVKPDAQPALAEYANGQRSLQSLIGALQP